MVKEELMLYSLEEMSHDGGVVVQFGVFIPFEEKEMEAFFNLVDREKTIREEELRVMGLRPCPQVLSWADRRRDSLALENIQSEIEEKNAALSKDIAAFRQQVLERFEASRK